MIYILPTIGFFKRESVKDLEDLVGKKLIYQYLHHHDQTQVNESLDGVGIANPSTSTVRSTLNHQMVDPSPIIDT